MAYPYSSICVFCGSALSPDPAFAASARKLGQLMAQQGITLVYGGGRIGMMGELAAGALSQNGAVIGVTHKFETQHAGHKEGLARLEIMEDLQQRKKRMTELADAFIILPGGFGTMDEFFEVLARSQVGVERKPIALLNVKGYFDHLAAWVGRAEQESFICPEHVGLYLMEEGPGALLESLAGFRFPDIENWYKRE